MKIAISFINIGLAAFLGICYFFEPYLSIPHGIQIAGRFHLMLLHLPIGLFAGSVLLYWLKGRTDKEMVALFLHFNSSTALLAAILGIILAQESGYDPEGVSNHKHTGVGFSALCYLWSLLFQTQWTRASQVSMIGAGVLLAWAGHEGGTLTHGDDFLLPSTEMRVKEIFTTESSTYEVAIQTLFDAKCISCHKSSKSKGELILTDTLSVKKGGESGNLWNGVNVQESKLWQVLELPLDHKEHMPPEGKIQLTKEERNAIKWWISAGASFQTKLVELPDSDSLKMYCLRLIDASSEDVENYTFASASASDIRALASDYIDITALSQNSPALSVNFFVSSAFDPNSLKGITKISDQIVRLNLSRMPLEDVHLKELLPLQRLEKLILNETRVTDEGVKLLTALPNLKVLSLTGTNVSAAIESFLGDFKAVEKIFLAHSAVSSAQLVSLAEKFPNIQFVSSPDAEDVVVSLSPPTMVNERSILKEGERVELSHVIKDVELLFTVDGSDPDSTKGIIYKEPISFSEYMDLRVIARKKGWSDSAVATYKLVSSGLRPRTADLITSANPKYLGSGSATLINGEKALITNFGKEWLGYKENELEALFSFENDKPIKKIVLSYGTHVPSYIFPPVKVEVWAGNAKDKMVLVSKKDIPAVNEDKASLVTTDALELLLTSSEPHKYYKLIAMNLRRLPPWHEGKGTPAWLFVDEVFFYE